MVEDLDRPMMLNKYNLVDIAYGCLNFPFQFNIECLLLSRMGLIKMLLQH